MNSKPRHSQIVSCLGALLTELIEMSITVVHVSGIRYFEAEGDHQKALLLHSDLLVCGGVFICGYLILMCLERWIKLIHYKWSPSRTGLIRL